MDTKSNLHKDSASGGDNNAAVSLSEGSHGKVGSVRQSFERKHCMQGHKASEYSRHSPAVLAHFACIGWVNLTPGSVSDIVIIHSVHVRGEVMAATGSACLDGDLRKCTDI